MKKPLTTYWMIWLKIILISIFLSACSGANTINADMITLNLPENIRKCQYAPKSPGSKATKKQVARYILKLYNSWQECHGDLKVVNKLYLQYRDQLKNFDLATGDSSLDLSITNMLGELENANKKVVRQKK